MKNDSYTTFSDNYHKLINPAIFEGMRSVYKNDNWSRTLDIYHLGIVFIALAQSERTKPKNFFITLI